MASVFFDVFLNNVLGMEIRSLLANIKPSADIQSTMTENSTHTMESVASGEFVTIATNEESDLNIGDKTQAEPKNTKDIVKSSPNESDDENDCVYISATHYINLISDEEEEPHKNVETDESHSSCESLSNSETKEDHDDTSVDTVLENSVTPEFKISNEEKEQPDKEQKIDDDDDSSSESLLNNANREADDENDTGVVVIENNADTEIKISDEENKLDDNAENETLSPKESEKEVQCLEEQKPKILYAIEVKHHLETPSSDLHSMEINNDLEMKEREGNTSNDAQEIPASPKVIWSQLMPSAAISSTKTSQSLMLELFGNDDITEKAKALDDKSSTSSGSSDTSSSKNSKNNDDSSDNSSDTSSTSSSDGEKSDGEKSDGEKSDQDQKSSDSDRESGEVSDEDGGNEKKEVGIPASEEFSDIPDTPYMPDMPDMPNMRDTPEIKKPKMDC